MGAPWMLELFSWSSKPTSMPPRVTRMDEGQRGNHNLNNIRVYLYLHLVISNMKEYNMIVYLSCMLYHSFSLARCCCVNE